MHTDCTNAARDHSPSNYCISFQIKWVLKHIMKELRGKILGVLLLRNVSFVWKCGALPPRNVRYCLNKCCAQKPVIYLTAEVGLLKNLTLLLLRRETQQVNSTKQEFPSFSMWCDRATQPIPCTSASSFLPSDQTSPHGLLTRLSEAASVPNG